MTKHSILITSNVCPSHTMEVNLMFGSIAEKGKDKGVILTMSSPMNHMHLKLDQIDEVIQTLETAKKLLNESRETK